MPLSLSFWKKKKRDRTGNVGEWECGRDTRTGLPPSPTMTPVEQGENGLYPAMDHTATEDKSRGPVDDSVQAGVVTFPY